MQGPEPYLNDLGLEFACAVHPDRKAVLDAEHRVFVNYETYYVSDRDAHELFLGAPHRYAGRITDPVSHQRFSADADSPRRDRAGRIFYFAGAETVARFDEDPDRFSTPMLSMVPAAR